MNLTMLKNAYDLNVFDQIFTLSSFYLQPKSESQAKSQIYIKPYVLRNLTALGDAQDRN